jgi:anaerobic selenocysteine-containing dehydrogenase
MPRVGREILEATDPPIRVIVVTAANPVCMAPHSARVAEGFDKAEFVVQMSHFLDDTSDHADLFLPCATFLEERDIVASYGHNYVGPVNRAIEPLGECRSQFDIFMDLASRFPFAREYVKSEGGWLRMLLGPLLARGVAYEDLWRGPVRIPDAPMVPWADRVFATPSGKFRFMTELETPLERTTAPAAPDWLESKESKESRESRESPVSMGSMGSMVSMVSMGSMEPLESPASPASQREERFPFTLLSVGSPDHLCSERTLADHEPLPLVSLNAEEAARRSIPDGGEATLISAIGSLRVKVRHVPDQRADVAVCYRGGWIKAGHGINTLVPEMISRVGDGTPYYEARVGLE